MTKEFGKKPAGYYKNNPGDKEDSAHWDTDSNNKAPSINGIPMSTKKFNAPENQKSPAGWIDPDKRTDTGSSYSTKSSVADKSDDDEAPKVADNAVVKPLFANQKDREAFEKSNSEPIKPITGGSTAEYEKNQKKEVSEDLKGNQTKIDANKNGKVDGQDFKILKARKGLAEEDAYDYDRYLVKDGKAVKDNPKAGAEKDGPNHVHASSAEHAMKKFAAKKRVNEASSSDPDFGAPRPDGSKKPGDIEFKPAPDSKSPEGGVSKEPPMPLPPKRPPNLKESAPKGDKFERMVKHIKDKYSKDGKLTDKEKSIAYATAWKAKNKDSE
jgi:hypothetical protein